MTSRRLRRSIAWTLVTVALAGAPAGGQSPTPTPGVAPAAAPKDSAGSTAATPAPPSPVTGIRNKVSAGDLRSAESVLEVHRAKNGEDGPWLVGLSWLARGALLLGEGAKADRYAAEVRTRCADSLTRGVDLTRHHDVEIALGAAIEVSAQRLEQTRGPNAAIRFLRDELARHQGPVAFRSRLQKRLNMLAMAGTAAPEIAIEDYVGTPPPTLASLKGRPVLLFVWAEYCGDCRAQEPALARVQARYADRGLQILALTRYYQDDAPARAREKARVDSVWKADYKELATVPIVLSAESAERYGGSSTPTFVFIDRAGIVRRYTPTRLTEAELDRTLSVLTR